MLVAFAVVGSLPAQEPARDPNAAAAVINRVVKDAGWNTINSVRVSIEIEDPQQAGEFQAVSPKHEFRDGQRFRLRLTSEADLHVYVLVHNADDSREVLEPAEQAKVTRLKAKETLLVPQNATYEFLPPAGKERLRVIVSPQPLPWVEAEQLFAVQNGDTLTEQEEAALAQLKSLKAIDVPKAFQHATGLKSAKSLDDAARDVARGTIPHGARCLIVEDLRKEMVISLTSPQRNDRAILVADFELNHK